MFSATRDSATHHQAAHEAVVAGVHRKKGPVFGRKWEKRQKVLCLQQHWLKGGLTAVLPTVPLPDPEPWVGVVGSDPLFGQTLASDSLFQLQYVMCQFEVLRAN